MRKRDILHLCLQNLGRRKSRTLLTVLGVMIGCCAIIIMVSLGFGTQEAQEKMLANMGDLTIINVYNYNTGSENKLDDATVNAFRNIKGVKAATPKLDMGQYYGGRLYAGANRRYATYWANVIGVDTASCEDMGYELIEGSWPKKADEILVGQYFAYEFRDSMRPEGMNYVDRYSGGWDEEGNPINIPDAYFDPLGTTITLEIQLSDGRSVANDLKVTGILKEDWNRGGETSYGITMDVSAMRSLIEKMMVQENIKKEISYNEVYIKAKDIDLVADVQSEVKTYGFETWSMESIREPLQKEAQQKQLMLGGLGAISLLVAAIGIANTMIMSISERTREIGIMKALGCYVGNIRAMFLTEAGMIGLIGGIIGIIVSLIIMIVINLVAFKSGFSFANVLLCFTGGETVTRTSVIPLWLVAFAVVFAILIGVGSGYYPANKAVKVSALEAIKSSE